MARRHGAAKRKAEADDAAANSSSADGQLPSSESSEATRTESGQEAPREAQEALADSNSDDSGRGTADGDIVSDDSASVASAEDVVGDEGSTHSQQKEDGGDESEEDDDEEEEILVVMELADFKNHPILDDYKSITIEGIDTASPMLHIGEYSLHGQLEETVGTHYFYDTKNRTEANEYRFIGQTTKKIKFTIAPPEEF